MTAPVEVFVPIAFFAMIVLVVYFTSKYNYQIKKAILEKGGNIELTKKKFPFLELGFVIFGIGLGLAASALIQSLSLNGEAKDLLTSSSILLFGGAGLVSSFFIRKKLDGNK